MRALLIILFGFILTQHHALSQIKEFPYFQGFEEPFLEFGSNVRFIENWEGNQVQTTQSRIYLSPNFSRNGQNALGVQPISSFNGAITIDLDLTSKDLMRAQFYARTIKNGTGSRPLLVYMSTSIDGGINYIKSENIGDETTFPNDDTDYTLYIYDLPSASINQRDVKLKLEIQYTSIFGVGTAARFILDDLFIYEKEEDVKIIDVLQPNAEMLEIVFNQEIDKNSGENHQNYSLEPANMVLKAERNERSKNIVNLQLSQKLKNGVNQLLAKAIYNIQRDGVLEQQKFSFTYIPPPVAPKFNELLITEIMANPEPSIGLPISEYVELFNASTKTLTLKDIKFSDASSSTMLPDFDILPGEYLLVVPRTKLELFEGISSIIGVTSWPSLNVGGDQLSLSTSEGSLIFSVGYDKSWYKDPLKNSGGWSLEMIDVNNPCGEIVNWAASSDGLGGTPARPNSIQAENPDLSAPQLNEVMAIQSDKVLLRFNEKIYPDLLNFLDYAIFPDIGIFSAELQAPAYNSILLSLEGHLEKDIDYKIIVNNIKDCAGNSINEKFSTSHFGLPEVADSLNIIINEVLFNPRTGGVKFVEIYNNSAKFINLKNWKLGNDTDIHKSTIRNITNDDFILKPHSYLAITQDNDKLKSEYPKGKEDRFFEVSSLPSYTISEGTVVLHNEKGQIMDHFSYSDDNHSSLLKSTKGVSLERISFNGISNHTSNWQSAASTVGFATPGYKNSQFMVSYMKDQRFKVEPKIIVPENMGFADFTSINFKLSSGGYYGTLKILDTKGSVVKKIANKEQLPTEGFFTWDGTDDNNRKVRIGYYLVYFEIYNLEGNVEIMKETVVVGKRF